MSGTLLLVDDDPNDQLLMLRSLRKVKTPMTFRVVSDGEEAISYLKGEGVFADRRQFPTPKITLLDIKMPRRSGFEVLQWIRSQPLGWKAVVVMLSSSKQPEDVRRAYSLGANSYLMKPFGLDDLQEMSEVITDYWVAKNVIPLQ